MTLSNNTKHFSYKKHALIGSAAGATIGAINGMIRGENENKGKEALANAAIGAGAGAGIGMALKYGKKRYKKFIGPEKVKKNIEQKIEDIKFTPGDIVIADRGIMKHYGIVVDKNGTIVEYGSNRRDPRFAEIRKVKLSEFKGNSPVTVEAPNGSRRREDIIKQAESLVGTNNGVYNLRENNCEHFARGVVNGKRESTQVNETVGETGSKIIGNIKSIFSRKKFSAGIRGQGIEILNRQGDFLKKQMLKGDGLFNIRKNLTKELGGLSHFDRNQTRYISGGGSILGGAIGYRRDRKLAEKEAEERGYKKGSYEYNDFIRNRSREGFVKGAAVGAGIGYGASRGIDTVRGKILADKIKAKHGIDMKKYINRNYMNFGKNMRGVHSEKMANDVTNRWKEVMDLGGNFYKAL